MTEKKHTPSYTAEFRARGVRLFRDHRSDYSSDSAAYRAIASKLCCSSFSRRDWYRRAARDAGELSGPTSEEKARIKALERENRELRQANEILRKASAYFAMAELVLWNPWLLRQKGAAARHRKLRGSGGGGVVRSLVLQDRGRVDEPPSFLTT
jgi:transposase-like protein